MSSPLKITVITLFPELIAGAVSHGVLGRAIDKNLVTLECVNPRDFTTDRHRTVDDRPYGGGPGMLMMTEPLVKAIESVTVDEASNEPTGEIDRNRLQRIYLSPQGQPLTQERVRKLAKCDELVLVAGRYEGIDERVIESHIDAEVCVGDFIVSGGEIPALMLIDAVARVLPGALGHKDSAAEDSFEQGLLDHQHYTRPEQFAGQSVPAVLLSGDHQAIRRWRLKQSLGRTWLRRPELLKNLTLDEEQEQLLAEFKTEYAGSSDD